MNEANLRRITALQAGLERAGIACAVLSRPQHLFFYAGIPGSSFPIFLLVHPHGLAAVAPEELVGIETFRYVSYDIQRGWSVPDAAAAALGLALDAFCPRAGTVGLETPFLAGTYLKVIETKSATQRDLGDLLWNLRKIREAGELEQIRANHAGNDLAFARLREKIRAGTPEFELWAIMVQTLCETAAEPINLQADLGVGLRGALPDSKAGLYRVEEGDAVFADLYTTLRGYTADTTRTFIAGKATPQQRAVHDVLLNAMTAGEARLRPGERACDVDAAVRGTIARAGYGPNFPHHSGHASGFFHQDRPYFIPAETIPLEAGMVVTLEPGIYIPGWGGMRIEHNYLIESSGPPSILDQYPIELSEI
jgi:Xaa-Pro aminopeptidase